MKQPPQNKSCPTPRRRTGPFRGSLFAKRGIIKTSTLANAQMGSFVQHDLKDLIVNDSIYTRLGKACRGKGPLHFCVACLLGLCLLGGVVYLFFHFGPQSFFEVTNNVIFYSTIVASLLIYGKEIRAKMSLVTIQNKKGHIVICGLGDKGSRLAQEFVTQNTIVIIEPDRGNPAIPGCIDKGMVVVSGDARDGYILDQANVANARLLFAVAREDSVNIEIAKSAHDLLSRYGGGAKGTTLRCHAHVQAQSTRETFCHHDLFRKTQGRFDASLFNVYDSAARYIFERFPPDTWARRQQVREELGILVVGFNAMGEAIIKQGIRVGHYLDWPKLNITVLDGRLEERGRLFMGAFDAEYPLDSVVPDVSLHFVENDPSLIRTQLNAFSAEGTLPSIVYLALNDDAEAISLAIKIRGILAVNDIPIVICLNSSLAGMTHEFSLTENRNIHAFDILDYACSWPILIDRFIDSLAKIIHSRYVCSQLRFKDIDVPKGGAQRLLAAIRNDMPASPEDDAAPDPIEGLNRILEDPGLAERLKPVPDATGAAPAPETNPAPHGDATADAEDGPSSREERLLRKNSALLAAAYPGICPNKLGTLNSLTPWNDLTEDKKESCRWQADHLSTKLRATGWDPLGERICDDLIRRDCSQHIRTDRDAILRLLNAAVSDPHLLDTLSELEHRRWVAALLVDGWKYAPGRKDSLLKTHPLLVPYATLPPEEKAKDTNIIAGIMDLIMALPEQTPEACA